MKVRWGLLFALILLALVSVVSYTSARVSAQGKAPSKAPAKKELSGCICGFDEVKTTVKVVPWNQDAQSWDSENTKVFVYQDKTIIEGESKATVAELKSGKAVKSFHITGISMGGVSGSPFEIKSLSQCVGRRTTLYWGDVKGASVANRITLPYLFGGESIPAMVGEQGAQAITDDCPPCRAIR